MKVYVSNIKNLFADEMYKRLIPAVSEPRKQKAHRFLKIEDKVRCLYAEILLKKVHPTPFENGFLYDGFGKPYIQGGNPFSISHSGDTVAVALADFGMTGIDIQAKKPVNNRIFKRVLSENELAFLGASEDKEDTFFTLWTIKEAASKAMGTGFRIPPSQIICADRQGIKTSIEYNGKTLYISVFEPFLNYKLAICAEMATNEYEIIHPEDII